MASDYKTQITEQILPRAQERVAAAIGKDVPIDVAFDTINDNKDQALQVLSALGGYYVVMRLVLVMEMLVHEYDAQQDLKDNLSAIRIEQHQQGDVEVEAEQTESSITSADGTLTLSLPLTAGVGHIPSKFSLQKRVAKALRLAGRKQRKEVDEVAIPEAKTRIKEVMGVDMPIEVEWDTVYDQPDFESAMHHLSWLRGHYVFGRAASALYQTIDWEGIDKDTVAGLVSKIRVRGLPGQHYRARYVHLEDGVLEIGCAFTYWSGIPHVYEMKMLIKNECIYRELDHKLASGASLSAEEQERKIDALEDTATRVPVINGQWQELRRVLEHRCFFYPDDVEKDSMNKFMEHYAGYDPDELRRTKRERWTDLNRISEGFIHGWRINKINHRGQEQIRLAVLTNKAFYTVKWNYKKEEPELRRTHRISHDDYCCLDYGKLKQESAFDGAAGAAADAVSGESTRCGLRYRTEIITSRKESMLKDGIAKFLKGKEVQAVRSLADKQLSGKDDLPTVDIPGYHPLDPHGVCRVAAGHLATHDNNNNNNNINTLPEVSILADGGDEEKSIPIGYVFAVLEDSLEGMEKEPELSLPNAPNLAIDVIFNQVLDILDKMDNIDLEFPTNLNLAVITRKITDKLSEMDKNKIPKFQLPSPEPLTISQIVESLDSCLGSTSNNTLPSVEIPGCNATLGSVNSILSTLKDKFGDQKVEFPPYPSCSLLDVLEKIGEAFGDMSGLPDMELLELSVGGTSIKSAVPSIHVGVPGGSMMRKLRGEEPRYFEMIFEPVVSNEDLLEPITKEMAWAIYGSLRAYHTPYYVGRPWRSTIRLPNTHVGTLYNKMKMGNDKKPDNAPNENEEETS